MHREMKFHYHKELSEAKILSKNNKSLGSGSNFVKPFFEGWYFKCTSVEVKNIAVIFGVSSSKEKQQSFIQIVHHSNIQGYYEFNLDAFSVEDEPFIVRIGESTFTEKEAIVSMPHLCLRLQFDDIDPLPSSVLHPSVMGPLLYLKHLPCYHHIISLHNNAHGELHNKRENTAVSFTGLGYMEKDYGVSFPTGYGWCHGVNEDAMIVAAVAMVPYIKKDQVGFFAVLKKGNQVFRFSTYQFGKVKRFSHYQSKIYMEFEQFLTQVSIHIEYQESCQLRAPKNGIMDTFVEESLDCKIHVMVERKEVVLFEEVFTQGTSEVFEYARMCFKQT